MSTTRLLMLGAVRIFQPVHGYFVRRELMTWRAEDWASLNPGSVYNALRTLARDGFLEEVATEASDGRPARTSYRLTDDGETEFLYLLRDALWQLHPDALCDRVLVIDHGRIVAEGSPEALKRRIAGDAIELVLVGEADAATAAALVADPQLDGARVRFTVPSAVDALPHVFRALDDAGVSPVGVEVHRPTLDDVFLSLTGRALRDEVAA